MNLYATPSLAAAIGCFAIGMAIGSRRSSRTTPRAFGVHALIFALTYFTHFNALQASSDELAKPWVVASGVLWPFVVPSLWRFAAAFTDNEELVGRLLYRLVFDLPALSLAALALFLSPFRRTPEHHPWGWATCTSPPSAPTAS